MHRGHRISERMLLIPTEKIHGIITNGGESANIIPDYTRSSWMMRAQKTSGLKVLERKIVNNLITDKNLAKIFTDYSKDLGIDMKTNRDFDQSKNGSTDFGNISKKFPSKRMWNF